MKKALLRIADRILIDHCWVAEGFFSRFRGLMGRRALPDEEGILFPACNSIHTFFMRFPIDVVFLSQDGRVIEIVEDLPSWRLLLPRTRARHVLELRSHRSRELGIAVGSQLRWEEVA